ncbi:YbjN domain-containing protein [Defluviitalea saccharophila]|uniref:YbjN domain-containing protein n=1 Tax=Defluviitalea saccharophila TaxID=879970 RepID=A0ABZ2Y7F9_9FIRM
MKQKIYDEIKNIVIKNNWNYIENIKELGIEKMLAISVTTDNGQWVLVIRAIEEENRLICYSVLPVEISEDKRFEAMEAITKINYGLKLGNFEIDLGSGEIHFKTGIQFPEDFEGNIESWIEDNIALNVATMDKYYNELTAISN